MNGKNVTGNTQRYYFISEARHGQMRRSGLSTARHADAAKRNRCGVNPVHGPCCQERYSLENEWVGVPDGECPSLVPGTVTLAVQDSGKSRKRSIGEALQREAAAHAATVEVKNGDFRNIVTR